MGEIGNMIGKDSEGLVIQSWNGMIFISREWGVIIEWHDLGIVEWSDLLCN